MIRKILAAFGGLVLAMTAVVALAAPAQASTAQCSGADWYCMYFDTYFTGQFSSFSQTVGCHSVNSTWNDQVSSILNKSGHFVYLFELGACNFGGVFDWVDAIPAHTGYGTMPGENDELSSYYVCAGNTHCLA